VTRQARIGRIDQREKLLTVALKLEASPHEVKFPASQQWGALVKWIGLNLRVDSAVLGSHVCRYPTANDLVALKCFISVPNE
jgi:hypothetical protein